MNVRLKIFKEMIRKNYGANYVWSIQEQMSFKNNILNPEEQKQFNDVMFDLKNEGIFSLDERGVWRLTSKSADLIYSN